MYNRDFVNLKISPTAKHTIKFEYCGGWGYSSYVDQTMEEVEFKYPGVYNFFWYQDEDMTGRFEVTLFKGATNENGCGTLIFSGL